MNHEERGRAPVAPAGTTPARRWLAWILLACSSLAAAIGFYQLAEIGEGSLWSYVWARCDFDEERALDVMSTLSGIGLACAAATLVRPLWIAALPLAIWFGMWSAADVWNEVAYGQLVPAAHTARWIAPLALAVLAAGRSLPGPRRLGIVRVLLTLGSAATFAVHGWEAWDGNPEFLDFLFGLSRDLGLELEQSRAALILRGIGLLDALAALGILMRFRTALAWMVFWAAATAVLRPYTYGEEFLPDMLIRLPFSAVPAALWVLLPPRQFTPAR